MTVVAAGYGVTMRDHLEAVAERWAPGIPVDLFAAEPGRIPSFAILEAPSWGGDPDADLSGTSRAFEVDMRVKVVMGTPAGVDVALTRARQSIPGPYAVGDRRFTMAWVRAEMVYLDTDATIPSTNRHPAIGVETYRLTSQRL